MCACARACVCWVGCSPHSSEAERQKGQWPHFTRGASGGMQSRVIDSGGEEAQPAGQPWFWQVDLTGEPTLTSRPTLSNHRVVCRVIRQLRVAVVPGLCWDNMRVWWEQKPRKTNSPKSSFSKYELCNRRIHIIMPGVLQYRKQHSRSILGSSLLSAKKFLSAQFGWNKSRKTIYI